MWGSESMAQKEAEGEPVKKAAKQFDEMLTEMPWLQHLDERQGFEAEVSALFSRTSSGGSEGLADSPIYEDAFLQVSPN